jgi:hypothetical protein
MPDTIKKHRAKLLAPYEPAMRAASVVKSAKLLAQLILEAEELLPAHRKKMLKEVLWMISEADGKYSTRYRSAEVVRLANEQADSDVLIQHEHVFPKAKVATRLLRERQAFLANPGELEKLLDQTIGCVVTKDEHNRLGVGEGWARYAAVPVLDMSATPPRRMRGNG